MSSLAIGPVAPEAMPRTVAVAYHGGVIVPVRQATLPVTTQALAYGTAVFEGIRAYQTVGGGSVCLFRLYDHLARLRRSATALRIRLDESPSVLAEVICELLRRNGPPVDSYIRPLAYKLALEPGARFGVKLAGVSSQLTITTLPMGRYVPTSGLRCVLSRYRHISRDSIPAGAKVTGGYVVNALAVQEAHDNGCDDAILLDAKGFVTEASTSNVFAVMPSGEVVTPPASADILPGITRDTVITLMRDDLRAPVSERPLAVSELRAAREVFLTGTGVEIAPVVSIDGQPVGDGVVGPVAGATSQLYADVVRGLHESRSSWLTPVMAARDRDQS